MQFEMNDKFMTSTYDPSVKEEDDYGWWETVGLQFDQQSITDMSYSENLQYNKTTAKILYPDREEVQQKAASKMTAFTDWATQWGEVNDGASGLTREAITYYDNQLNSGKVKFDKFGNIEGDFRETADLREWYKLKQMGYTPESFHEEVVKNSQKEIYDYAQQIQTSNSMTAQGMGSLSAWLADPTNFSMLALEIGGTLLTKSPGTATALREGLIKTGFKKEFADKVSDRIMNRAHEVYRTRKDEAINVMDGNKQAWREFRNFTLEQEKKGTPLKTIDKMVKNKIKNGEFKYGGDIDKLVKYNRNKEFKDLRDDMAMYTIMSSATEAIHQFNTFDFKNQVLPDYTMGNAVADVFISGLLGGAIGGTVDIGVRAWNRHEATNLANKLITEKTQIIDTTEYYSKYKIPEESKYFAHLDENGDAGILSTRQKSDQISGEITSAEISPEVIYEGFIKAGADISQDKFINVEPDKFIEGLNIDFDNVSKLEIDKYTKEMEKDAGWQPIGAEYDKSIQEYEKIRQCVLSNTNK